MRRIQTILLIPLAASLLLLAAGPAWSASGLGPIVIRTERDPASIGEVAIEDNAGNYRLIRRERYAHRSTTVAEVIEAETGIQVRQAGGLGSYSTVSLRGASEQQVMVFVDGLPLNQAAGGGVDLGRLDLGQVEAIEIYRGRTPVEFGLAAPGGAINIRTRRAQGGTSKNSVETGIGSFGAHTARFDSLGSRGNWDHALVLHGHRSENDFEYVNKNRPFDPADPRRERAEQRNNADSDRYGLLARLGYRADSRQRLEGSISWLDQDQGLPSFNNAANTRSRLQTEDQLLQLRWSGFSDQPEGWARRVRLFQRRLDEDYDDRASQIGLGGQLNRDRTSSHGLDAFVSRGLGRHRFSSSLLWQQESYQSQDLLSGSRSPEVQRRTLALAAELDARLLEGRLSMTPALRALVAKDDGAGANGFDDSYFTPQLGLRYLLNDSTSLMLNAGRYLRLPSFFEQFGDRGFIVGNPALEAETSDNVDVGIEWQGFGSGWLTRSRIEASLFISDVEDAIAYVFDARGVGRAMNIGEAHITGVELSLELALRSATRIEIDITTQEPENRSVVAAFNGKRLPGRYSDAYNLRIEQWLGQHTRLFYRYHGERGLFYDSANLLAATDRDEHDLGLLLSWRSWRAGLEARNLKNENFQSFNGFPEPGRSYWATVAYHF